MKEKNLTNEIKNSDNKGAYEKTLLYLYPHMKKMSEALKNVIETQARLSYRTRENAEALVDRLLNYGWQARFLTDTANEIELLLELFSGEERFILEYRYFRRKKALKRYEGERLEMSLRTFYRRQHGVLKKFSSLLLQKGMDEKWFFENFSGMDWAMTVYKKVCAGKDSFILGKFKNSPFFRRTDGEEAAKGAGFLLSV